MGACGARRRRGIAVSLGRYASGDGSRLRQAVEAGAGAGGAVRSEYLWVVQSRRQRPRMVRGLVRRRLLRALARTESSGAEERHAAGFAGRLVAASYQGYADGGAFQHSAGIPIRGLRIPRCAVIGLEEWKTRARTETCSWPFEGEGRARMPGCQMVLLCCALRSSYSRLLRWERLSK